MEYRYRPIQRWPGELTLAAKRQGNPFRAKFNATIDLLDKELFYLKAKEAVIQLALEEGEIRNDGLPRANSRPKHPGVILAFDSRHGPLQYATDRFEGMYSGETGWHANLRAIALGLQALRAVDRYGITRHGEQYTGWKAIGPGGTPMPPPQMTTEDAVRLLLDLGDPDGELAVDFDDILSPGGGYDVGLANTLYRRAAQRFHPDAGGDPEIFLKLTEAKRSLQLYS